MESSLEKAVNSIAPQAATSRCGMLVTRTGPGTFTVDLSSDVPYGTTKEATTW
jgi:hypothetical protein